MTSVPGVKDAEEGARSGWVAVPHTLVLRYHGDINTVVFTLNIQFNTHVLQLLQSYVAVVDFYFYRAVK